MTLDIDLRVPGRVEARLELHPGEVLAVIGPNGAGKSTLVHALAGLVPAEGHAVLDGRDLLTLPTRERDVGLVFQRQLLFPHLTAEANIAFGPRARGVSRAEAHSAAREWLRRFQIGDLGHRKPRELSGGQAQRVAIARALATSPGLLLLDEPLTGLDVKIAMALRIELGRHLAAYDGISIIVTHHALDALTIADRVLVLDEGSVAQLGTPAEVSSHPATDHVARLVGLNVVREDAMLTAFPPEVVAVSLERPSGSARLRWQGEVVDVSPHGDAVRVLVRTSGDQAPDLIADVTPAAATELGLVPGTEVWLAAKETAVRRYELPAEPLGTVQP